MSIQLKSASLCTNTRKTNHSFSAKLSLIHCETFLASEMKEMVLIQWIAVSSYLSKEEGSTGRVCLKTVNKYTQGGRTDEKLHITLDLQPYYCNSAKYKMVLHEKF